MNLLRVMRCLKTGLVLVLGASMWSAAIAHPAQEPSDRLLVKKASDSYYNLRRLGLVEFRASIKPNWKVVLADEIKKDPASADAGLKMLNGLHFAMLLDQKGSIYVTHSSEVSPTNDQMFAAFDQIYSGMDQIVHGFFDTWSLFNLTSAFPTSDSEFQLKDTGNLYELNYHDGPAAVKTIFSKDFLTKTIQISGSGLSAIVRPVLSKTSQGIVLTGYDGVYDSDAGRTQIVLHVEIEQQEVNSLQLPRTLKLSGSMNGEPFKSELSFSDYEVKTR